MRWNLAFWSHLGEEILSFYLNTREINSPSPLVISHMNQFRIIIFGEMVVFARGGFWYHFEWSSRKASSGSWVLKKFDLTLISTFWQEICFLISWTNFWYKNCEKAFFFSPKSSSTFLFRLRKKPSHFECKSACLNV